MYLSLSCSLALPLNVSLRKWCWVISIWKFQIKYLWLNLVVASSTVTVLSVLLHSLNVNTSLKMYTTFQCFSQSPHSISKWCIFLGFYFPVDILLLIEWSRKLLYTYPTLCGTSIHSKATDQHVNVRASRKLESNKTPREKEREKKNDVE